MRFKLYSALAENPDNMSELLRTTVKSETGFIISEGTRTYGRGLSVQEGMKNDNYWFFKDLLKLGSGQWVVKDMEYTKPIIGSIDDLRNGKAIAANEDSFKDQHGSAT